MHTREANKNYNLEYEEVMILFNHNINCGNNAKKIVNMHGS